MIVIVNETDEAQRSSAITFVDLSKLNLDDPRQVAWKDHVLKCVELRKAQGYGGIEFFDGEGDLMGLIGELPKEAIIKESELPVEVHGLAILISYD